MLSKPYRRISEIAPGVLTLECVDNTQEITQWSILEMSFSSQNDHPWWELPLKAIFVHEQSGQEIATEGFWDGKNTYRVRFTLPLPGKWSWHTSSPDPGLDGKSGVLTASEPTQQQIDANPKLREQPNWFRDISGVYWRLARADRVVRMFELQQTEPKAPVQVHVVRIGDMAIATFPLAPYLDFGIQIKARSKAMQTFTVQTADGHYRYLPTERSLAGGAYGAVPESTVFGPKGGRELVEGTLELIESLWGEK